MKRMLGSDYEAFAMSYKNERYQALRVNPLKADRDAFRGRVRWELEEVPWERNGFYYSVHDEPGKHPYHGAGVYYIQEPSAMTPVHYLGAERGERILDLCAAPGGKSTQIAGYMAGEGVLVCNEINNARARILSQNIERLGVRNAMVLNETPDRLAQVFPGFFDRILADAPCSGEGMFRKNEDAAAEWSPENVEMCAARQEEILDAAAVMLMPGGRLVYSTCTFAPEEDEESVCGFLKRHPDFHTVPVEMTDGMESGRPEWTSNESTAAKDTIRLWPHKIKGEGHFLAVLERDGSGCASGRSLNGLQQGLSVRGEKNLRPFRDFMAEFIKEELRGEVFFFGEQLYLAPCGMPSVKGLKVMRPGLHLGTIKKDRFEPSHALALALRPEDVKYSFDMRSDSHEIHKYLNGQTLDVQAPDGWYLMTVDDYSTGWGKLAGGIMKNHYPKGLRINY